jgi:hypothetical protein
MFGTSISVVDVIYAPLFVRLEAAVQTRGLEIPDTLPVSDILMVCCPILSQHHELYGNQSRISLGTVMT